MSSFLLFFHLKVLLVNLWVSTQKVRSGLWRFLSYQTIKTRQPHSSAHRLEHWAYDATHHLQLVVLRRCLTCCHQITINPERIVQNSRVILPTRRSRLFVSINSFTDGKLQRRDEATLRNCYSNCTGVNTSRWWLGESRNSSDVLFRIGAVFFLPSTRSEWTDHPIAHSSLAPLTKWTNLSARKDKCLLFDNCWSSEPVSDECF